MTRSWIVQVKVADRLPFWLGNFTAPGRITTQFDGEIVSMEDE